MSSAKSRALSISIPVARAHSAVYTQPPSPTGSTKALYIRPRPSSLDGPVIGPFAAFSMTPARLPRPTSPPPQAAPKQSRRMYTHGTRSVYLGTSAAVSIRTTRTPVVPVRAIRRRTLVSDLNLDLDPAPAVAPRSSNGSWLVRIVPGILKRSKCMPDAAQEHEDEENAPLVHSSRRARSKHTKRRAEAKSPSSFKSAAPLSKGIENRAPRRPLPRRPDTRPFSYVYGMDAEDEAALGESMPEVLEALCVNARIRATGYRYERLDALEEFINRCGVRGES
ncbi:hypothetical protein DFH09DRAFT_1164517 [Mycena vulgaris]|nr:hypothetical protein DFH09DRAFT_1164517 [Mycena vulgaris]